MRYWGLVQKPVEIVQTWLKTGTLRYERRTFEQLTAVRNILQRNNSAKRYQSWVTMATFNGVISHM